MAEIKDLVRAVDSLTDEDRTHFLQMMALRYKNERQEKWDKLVYAACEALNNLLEVFPDVGIYDTDGNKIGSGFLPEGTDPNSMVGKEITPSTDGKIWTPKDPYDIKASISLDTNTGNIKISAPKDVYELPEFKNVFKEDVLKQY